MRTHTVSVAVGGLAILLLGGALVAASGAAPQVTKDLSGAWQLDREASDLPREGAIPDGGRGPGGRPPGAGGIAGPPGGGIGSFGRGR